MVLVGPEEVMFTCVGPAHLVRGVVIGEGVRKSDAIGHDHAAVLAVHRRAFNLRCLAVPIRPVEGAAGGRSDFSGFKK